MNPTLDPQAFFVAGGTLWREAPSYIVRPADEELLRLTLAGEYGNVLAARQMGKSSLMVRIATHLRQAGVRTAIIDLSALGGGISTPEAWFFGFLDELALQLGLDEAVETWWGGHAALNPVQRFTNFLREVVLAQTSTPVTIFVDEIDSALGLAFTDDFFAAIRAASNARAAAPEFQRLTFVLLGVARPADLIRDRSRTPYNVGVHIHLSDFTLPELEPFQAVFEAACPGQGEDIVQWVLDWTNGQPYLTQKLCAELIRTPENPLTPESVARLVTRLFLTAEARKESNLRAIQDRITSSPHKPRLLQVYAQVLRGVPVLDEERSPAKNELKLTGLVRPSPEGRLEIRNRIYHQVFDQAWVKKNLPHSPARVFAVLAGLLALAAFAIAGLALYNQRLQPTLTFAEQFATSNSPDVKLTSLARLLALDERSGEQARELYASLSHAERMSLFTELSGPQNVAGELVTVIEAVYQDNPDTPQGNEILRAMKEVLGQIGAPGAPGLKTEIEFWLKGREEAGQAGNGQTAVSFYDSAWAQSQARGHPNFSALFDRAAARAALGETAAAYADLQAVWEARPARRAEIAALVNASAPLARYASGHAGQLPALAALITPIPPTSAANPTPTELPSPTPSPAPTLTPVPTPTPAEPSPFAGWIAYASGEGPSREIVILNPQTGEARQITSNNVADEAPSFSGDNWKLVYASERGAVGWELYVYDLASGLERRLTDFAEQARFPAWSPVIGDGRILFEGRGPAFASNIWMVDFATGALEQITSAGADSRPAWAPDGTRFAFGRATADTTGNGAITSTDNLDLFLFDLSLKTGRNLTQSPTNDDFNFAWSPDGAWIAFTSVREDANGDGVRNLNDSRDLFLVRPDGSGETRLDLGDSQVFSPSWSPEGRYLLVLATTGPGKNEIVRLEVKTGRTARLAGPGALYHPSYAHAAPPPSTPPDLAAFDLAFVSDRDGEFGIYLMDTQDPRRWQMLPRPEGYERAWWPTFCDRSVVYEAQDSNGLLPQWLFFAGQDQVEPARFTTTLQAARLGVPRCAPGGGRMAFSAYLPAQFDGWLLALHDFSKQQASILSQNPSFGYVSWSEQTSFFLSMTLIDQEFYVLQTANYAREPALSTLAKGKYPALSPDGSRFVYLCANQGYLCLQDITSQTSRLLAGVAALSLAGETVPVTAAWSADGVWVYFASAASGNWDIYRIHPDGSDLQNLTASWGSNELMPALAWQR